MPDLLAYRCPNCADLIAVRVGRAKAGDVLRCHCGGERIVEARHLRGPRSRGDDAEEVIRGDRAARL